MSSNPTTDPLVRAEAHFEEELHRKHTNPVLVFVILTVLTVIEIVITLFNLPKSLIVPFLLAVSFTKAMLVAAYYMHLRYERWLYTAVFIAPASFAVFLIAILLS
jgi:cytochrome c oxidase subunit 4